MHLDNPGSQSWLADGKSPHVQSRCRVSGKPLGGLALSKSALSWQTRETCMYSTRAPWQTFCVKREGWGERGFKKDKNVSFSPTVHMLGAAIDRRRRAVRASRDPRGPALAYHSYADVELRTHAPRKPRLAVGSRTSTSAAKWQNFSKEPMYCIAGNFCQKFNFGRRQFCRLIRAKNRLYRRATTSGKSYHWEVYCAARI